MIELKDTYSQIGKASLIIVLFTFIDKILAILKEIIIAHQFGISSHLDVFNIAYALPYTVIILCSGAIVYSFIPLYIEWSNKNSPQQANTHALSLLLIVSLFFLILAVLCYLLSPVIFPLLGYGFRPDQKDVGVNLTRFLSFLIALDGLGIILTALLQAQKKFIILQLAQIFINVSIIFIIILQVNMGIYSLILGLLVGTILKIMFMAIFLYRGGFNFFEKVTFDFSVLTPFFYLALPLVGSELVANINIVIDQIMATRLSPGSVSTLKYAYRLNDLPIQVVILAITKAIFPFISEQALNKDYEGLRHRFKQSVIFVGFLTFPIMCFIGLFSEDIVAIVFRRGAFDVSATQQTAQTLLFYSFGLFFYSYAFVNGAFFSALKDPKPLFYMGLLSVILNILLNSIFMHYFAVKGIALSTTITMGIVCWILMRMLRKRLQLEDTLSMFNTFLRITISSLLMLFAGYLIQKYFISCGFHLQFYFPLTIIIIALIYLSAIWLLKTEDLKTCLNSIGRLTGLRFLRNISV